MPSLLPEFILDFSGQLIENIIIRLGVVALQLSHQPQPKVYHCEICNLLVALGSLEIREVSVKELINEFRIFTIQVFIFTKNPHTDVGIVNM